jgi:hypothetical protein
MMTARKRVSTLVDARACRQGALMAVNLVEMTGYEKVSK